MPFNGSGTFTRLMNWSNDALAGIKIKADRHDQEDDNLASGLTNCITKDGQTSPTADIPFNGKRLTNLGTPTVDTDAATKAYADLPKPFNTGATIAGADANGQVHFTSPTGANGLTFTNSDSSWLSRTSPNRIAYNNAVDGSGTDVATINDDGTMSIIGGFSTAGNVMATSVLGVKAASGNVHVWWYGADGGTRMILYTDSGAQGAGILNVGSANYTFAAGGDFHAAALWAGGALYASDGNISGGVWNNWGANDAYTAIGARIEARAIAWANDRVSNMQYRKVSLGYNATSGGFSNLGGGTVICGYSREPGGTGQVAGLYYVTLQVYDPVRGWVSFQS